MCISFCRSLKHETTAVNWYCKSGVVISGDALLIVESMLMFRQFESNMLNGVSYIGKCSKLVLF